LSPFDLEIQSPSHALAEERLPTVLPPYKFRWVAGTGRYMEAKLAGGRNTLLM
jgi:hypothetical protein